MLAGSGCQENLGFLFEKYYRKSVCPRVNLTIMFMFLQQCSEVRMQVKAGDFVEAKNILQIGGRSWILTLKCRCTLPCGPCVTSRKVCHC